MSEIRSLLADTVRRVFADGVDKERITEAETGAWLGDVCISRRRRAARGGPGGRPS